LADEAGLGSQVHFFGPLVQHQVGDFRLETCGIVIIEQLLAFFLLNLYFIFWLMLEL